MKNVSVERRTRAGVSIVYPVMVELQGPRTLTSIGERREAAQRRFVESRVAGVKLGIDAFVEQPLRGIGWERFPEYSRRHGDFGALPTHNEYVRVLAELGIIGLVLSLALAVMVVSATVRATGLPRVLAGGMLVSGAVGMVFVNGFTVSSATLPLALCAGTMLALRGRQQPPTHGSSPASAHA